MATIKEQIRAEIERRKKENMYDELPMTIGRYYKDRDLLSFLDTLPEQPESTIMTNEMLMGEINPEQPVEGAVEGVAHPDDCEIWVNLVGYGYKFKDGDKVKVIVIKED